MSHQTVILAYITAERASAAIQALRALGVQPDAIKRHPVSDTLEEIAAAPEPPTGIGFSRWLFGHDTVEDRIKLYRKALDGGGTIISVQVTEAEVGAIHRVLQDLGPVN